MSFLATLLDSCIIKMELSEKSYKKMYIWIGWTDGITLSAKNVPNISGTTGLSTIRNITGVRSEYTQK